MAETFDKRFSSSDVFILPYDANKQWNIPSESFDRLNIFGQLGVNPSKNTPIKDYTYENLVYKSVLAKFYPEFYPTNSLSTSSYYQTTNYTSSLRGESYGVSGSLLIGNLHTTIKNYPTSESAQIYILNVPHTVYSNKILPTTVELEIDGGYKVYDDGEYNIYWSGSTVTAVDGTQISQSQHVGNVFYEHGMIVFTSFPNITTPITMVNTLTTTDEICVNSGTITVSTTNGSGNFTYQLYNGIGTLLQTQTPSVGTNTYTFTSLSHDNYSIKITDNIYGDIETQTTTVAQSPLTVVTSCYITSSNITTHVNTATTKDVEIEYEIKFFYTDPVTSTTVQGIPSGVTVNLELENFRDFTTNYHGSSTLRSYTQYFNGSSFVQTQGLYVEKNGSPQTINSTPLATSQTTMVCDPTYQIITYPNRHYTNTISITSSDTLVIKTRNIISHSGTAPVGCPQEAEQTMNIGIKTINQTTACGTAALSTTAIPPNYLTTYYPSQTNL